MPHGDFQLTHRQLVWLALGAIGPGAVAGVVFIRCLSAVPAGRGSVLTLFEPLTALAIASYVWGESLGTSGMFGAAAVLVSGYFVIRNGTAPLSETVSVAEANPNLG